VHVKSFDAHRARALLGARQQLVGMVTSPIRNQSAGFYIIAFLVDGGQLMLGSKCDGQMATCRPNSNFHFETADLSNARIARAFVFLNGAAGRIDRKAQAKEM